MIAYRRGAKKIEEQVTIICATGDLCFIGLGTTMMNAIWCPSCFFIIARCRVVVQGKGQNNNVQSVLQS